MYRSVFGGHVGAYTSAASVTHSIFLLCFVDIAERQGARSSAGNGVHDGQIRVGLRIESTRSRCGRAR